MSHGNRKASAPHDARRHQSALSKRGVLKAYNARPAYQRNDYLGWIAQGKTDATQTKRTQQMLSELEHGGVYMGMKHGASAKKR